MKNFLIIYTVLFLVTVCGFSQNTSRNRAQKEILTLLDSANFYSWSSPDYSLKFSNEAEKKSKQINFIYGIVSSLKNQASAYYIKGYTDKALKKGIEAIKICEQNNYYEGIPKIANMLGLIYTDLKKYKKAIGYFDLAIKYGKKFKLSIDIPINNKANAFYFLKEYDKSLKLHKEALKIREKNNDLSGIADCKNDIGVVYKELKQYDKAYNYIYDCFKIKTSIRDTEGIAFSSLDLADLLVLSHKPKQALKYIDIGYKMAKEMNSPRYKEMCFELYARAFSLLKDFEKAYKYQVLLSNIRDSLKNEESIKKLAEMQAKYETEKKEQALKLKTAQLEKEKIEARKRTIQRNFISIALILVIILVIIIFRNYRQKKKANYLLNEQKKQILEKNEELRLLNENLNQQNEEIKSQRDEIKKQRDSLAKQKEIIEIIHNELSKSIDYATRLQQSILQEGKILNNYFSEHFVFFKPKDKVSGDFYWWTHIEGHTIVTVADCTGHGVPGAFMSMLGISLLREIVEKEYITHPAVILRRLRKEVIKILKQKGVPGEQKDGMDMALISVNHESKTIQFSGANNPLYIITNQELNIKPTNNNKRIKIAEYGKTKLYEIKPDKMPIAIYENMKNFTMHEIQVKEGDLIYMFSDGFADQFGGPDDKKFKYGRFKKLLLKISSYPLNKQKEILDTTFEEWKGNKEQIDDVTVLGIKI